MELILIVGVAMIMAVISLISMLSQTDIIPNKQTKWLEHSIPKREHVELAVNRSESMSRN